MAKPYLIAFGSTFGAAAGMKELLNKIPEVTKWRYDMSQAFYVISELSADELADKIHALKPDGRFIVTEIPKNSSGYLTRESWHLIQHLEYMPKAPAEAKPRKS